jgi:hypothetical protein
MKRSPILLALSLLFTVSVAVAQQQPASAEPKSGSGLPQPAANQPPQTGNPAPAAQPPAATSQPANASGQPQQSGQPASAPAQPQPSPQLATRPGETPTQPATGQGGSIKTETAAPEPTPVPQPKTEILDSSATSGAVEESGHDPILDPPPPPTGSTTLVGGIIQSVDRIRNRMVVRVFGGGHWRVNFDERTHIFRNGAETTPLALKKGERVYVDTMADQARHDIFARNIRLGITAPPADADGQVETVDAAHGEIVLRDRINSVPVHFGVDKETRITRGLSPGTLQDLKPGSLVHVKFAPESGNRGIAREVSIVAAPGSAFTFAGKLTYLDLRRGLLAIQNESDDRNYDIKFSPKAVDDLPNLGVGARVTIVATFEGTGYDAKTINVEHTAEANH